MANINLYRVSVPAGSFSKVSWLECDINPGPTQYLQNGLLSIDFQAQNNSVSASSVATVSIIGYCLDDCTGCYLIGETTTTSTTIPPVDFTLTPTCEGSGTNGTGKITVNGFSGGNGTYTSVAIGSSAGSALSATPIALSGASTYSFTGVFNGTWYVILRDSSGASTTKSTLINCTASTTTTTSTTTAAPICTYNGGSATITYTSTTTTTTSTTQPPTTTSTSTSTSTTTGAPTTTSTSTTTTAAPPASSYLTFEFIGSTFGTSAFKFTLSNSLSVDLTITGATVNIFEDFSCGASSGQASMVTSGTILAGGLSVTIDGPSSVCPQSYSPNGAITISGIGTVGHNGTFNAGGTTVTLFYDATECNQPLCT